ncbi:aspartate aminotransferase family protein [uncultured Eubacterium sp.]|uniref:aspartate aminotransferase family protein n=1 Tax=uncultured Eubacterium sp. TaxID=165185 RepID=UPI00258ACFFC|nr:aspartate aminotransferase family protein [uncultured Eubacterium sp.]
MNTKELDNKYIAHSYGRFDVCIVSGKGSTLFDENGKKYIDFGSGIGVSAFGACDDEWTKAVTEQLSKIQHTSNLYYTEPCAELAELLCEKTNMCNVFFGNSGAEANEGAIKFARKYSFDKYGEGRSTIITLIDSFHGRTITTLSATGQECFHTTFAPFTPGFKYCPANDIECLNKMITDDVCAIMFECIQGEGGVNNLSNEFVKEIEKIANEKDILMIVDEVQTGNGRTGKYFAYQNFDITPDIVTTAKGLGGGLPIGAVLFGEKLKNTVTPGSHGSTFGGNPIASAGAISIVKRIDDDFLLAVSEKSKYIKNEIAKWKNVENISGMGLMLGILTNKDAGEIAKECLKKGLLVLTAHKNKVRLLPALNISFAELNEGLDILKEVIEK